MAKKMLLQMEMKDATTRDSSHWKISASDRDEPAISLVCTECCCRTAIDVK